MTILLILAVVVGVNIEDDDPTIHNILAETFKGYSAKLKNWFLL